jgi:hypothetical protein
MRKLMAATSTALLLIASLGACSSQQLHATGAQWQRNECERLQDAAERNRCIGDSKRSYDDYQREKAAAQSR